MNSILELISQRPLLTKHDLARRWGLTMRTVERWVANGTLPRPVAISGPRWTLAMIARWEKSRADKRRPYERSLDVQP